MSEEVDMAMAYTEERKMRLEAMDRIGALMYNLVPLLSSSCSLVNGVMHDDHNEIAESIKTITMVRAQMEANMMLNMYDPVDGEAYFPDHKIRSNKGLGGQDPQDIDNMRDRMEACAKRMHREWDEFAEEYGLMTVSERREKYFLEIQVVVREGKAEKARRSETETA